VSKIDDPGDAEDDGQAGRYDEQRRCAGEAVQRLDGNEGKVHDRVNSGRNR
jgi:hypothetical protein